MIPTLLALIPTFIALGLVVLVNGTNINLQDIMDMNMNQGYDMSGKNMTNIGGMLMPCCPSPWYPTELDCNQMMLGDDWGKGYVQDLVRECQK